MKIKYIMNSKEFSLQIGGALDEYPNPLDIIKKILNKDTSPILSDKCKTIDELNIDTSNEGMHNIGTSSNNKLFYKFGVKDSLIEDFKNGYLISLLKPIYPYFIDVHTLINCTLKKTRLENFVINADVLIMEKGGETIFKYINRKMYEYMITIIPEYQEFVKSVDDKIFEILQKYNVYIAKDADNVNNYYINIDGKKIQLCKTISFPNEIRTEKNEYDKKINTILLKMNNEIELEYMKLICPYIKQLILFINNFKSDLLTNLENIYKQFFILDILTLLYFSFFISDKKSDNFMVTVEDIKSGDTKENIKFNILDTSVIINNTMKWNNTRERIYIYPVDFGREKSDEILKSIIELKTLIPNNIDIPVNIAYDCLNSSFNKIFYTDYKLNNIVTNFENKNNDIINSIKKMCFTFDDFEYRATNKLAIKLKMSNYDSINNYLSKINPFKIHFDNSTENLLNIMFPTNIPNNLTNIKDIINFGIIVLHGELPIFSTKKNKWIVSPKHQNILASNYLRKDYYEYLNEYLINLTRDLEFPENTIFKTFTISPLQLTIL